MRLIFLAGDFPPGIGGIQTYIAELCRALAHRGEELVVIATEQPGADAFDEAAPYPVRRVPGRDLLGTALAMSEAAAELASVGAVVVATKWSPEGVAAFLLRRRMGLLYVVMGYGREFAQTGGNLVKWLVQRTVFRGAAGGMAISRYTAGLMPKRGLRPERTRIIYAGVRPEVFEAAGDSSLLRQRLGIGPEKVVLTVSRLVARKGQEQVLRALAQARDELPPTRYLIVGDGPRRAELEAFCEQLGLRDMVTFAGEIADVDLPACYRLCDVFVMTSRDIPGEPIEGFGLVYLEANVCGKPVIAGATGGVADAVEDGVSGLLVDPERPEQIAEALRRLLGDDALARRLGEQGAVRARERFTWDRVAERFLEGLTDLGIGSPRGGRAGEGAGSPSC